MKGESYTKNTLSSKAHVHISKQKSKALREKQRLRAVALQFYRNVKRASLRRKEEAPIREMKRMVGRISLVTASITVKVADTSLMKLVERLKDEVVKLASTAATSS